MIKIAIFASGSGTNAVNIVKYFSKFNNIEVETILCNNPKALIIDKAKDLNIECLLFDKNQLYKTDFVHNYLERKKVDLIVLAGFLWLIPKSIIKRYSGRIINIHPALLPKYGGKGMYGMNVHKAVIENKEKFSGITIHYINEEYDEGDIIFQTECEVLNNDSPEELANRIHSLEYEFYPKIIQKIAEELIEYK